MANIFAVCVLSATIYAACRVSYYEGYTAGARDAANADTDTPADVIQMDHRHGE